MKFLLPIFILFYFSCKQPAPKLTLADLKFADYEREFIAKNKVDSMYEIIQLKNVFVPIMPYKYDSCGRLLSEGSGGFFQTKKTYIYDTLGFISEEIWHSDFTARDFYTYRFDENQNILSQYIRFRKQNKDTTGIYQKIYFDANGREILKIGYVWNVPQIYTYLYDPTGRLKEIKFKLLGDKNQLNEFIRNYVYNRPIESLSHLYYSNNTIDSVIVENTFLQPENNYTSRIYYNDSGLREKRVDYDTLISTYKYTFRK